MDQKADEAVDVADNRLRGATYWMTLDGVDWPESIKEMQRNWIGTIRGGSVVSFGLPGTTGKSRRVHNAPGHVIWRNLPCT